MAVVQCTRYGHEIDIIVSWLHVAVGPVMCMRLKWPVFYRICPQTAELLQTHPSTLSKPEVADPAPESKSPLHIFDPAMSVFWANSIQSEDARWAKTVFFL